MPATEAARRPICARCARPQPVCLCRWIQPVDNRLPLLVLQHPHESDQAKGSVRLLRLSLRDCHCEVGERFEPAALAAWLGESALLLYPGANTDAPPATRAAPPPPQAPRRLVLLDGTWRKTRKLLHLNPLLQTLPRYALRDPPERLYATRKAQRPEQRSTLEAACLALGQVGPAVELGERTLADRARVLGPESGSP